MDVDIERLLGSIDEQIEELEAQLAAADQIRSKIFELQKKKKGLQIYLGVDTGTIPANEHKELSGTVKPPAPPVLEPVSSAAATAGTPLTAVSDGGIVDEIESRLVRQDGTRPDLSHVIITEKKGVLIARFPDCSVYDTKDAEGTIICTCGFSGCEHLRKITGIIDRQGMPPIGNPYDFRKAGKR